jgi:hypothetical protein
MWARAGKYRRPTSPIIAKIIIAAIGAEVEKYLYGWSRWDDWDREAIANLLTLLPEGLLREDRLRRFARQLVRRHYFIIVIVASFLEERLELTGAEIDALMPSSWIACQGLMSAPCSGNLLQCGKCTDAIFRRI